MYPPFSVLLCVANMNAHSSVELHYASNIMRGIEKAMVYARVYVSRRREPQNECTADQILVLCLS